MKKLFLLMLSLMLFQCIFSEELTEEEMDTQYQKEMATIVSFTSTFRFGDNLNKGDYVEYQVLSSKDKSETISLEVIEKNEEYLVIEEKFDSLTVKMKYDPKSSRLIKVWGMDEEGLPQEMNIDKVLDDKSTLTSIKSQISEGTFTESFYRESKKNTLRTKCGELNCTIYTPNLSTKYNTFIKSKADKDKVNESMSYYMSSDVPKMYPLMHVAMKLMIDDTKFKSNNEGFVKSNSVELIAYKKGEK